ncbi:MAG: protein translocase subunit SecD, partial [Rikenellaceae bacterium]|nr:protein translocase subunit SecD [Rikenellaceae bacterium]
AKGAETWAQLTANNVGKCIAIVMDGYVYSAPRVNEKITGGSSSITGNFTSTEARDLANVLKSGKLPAPAKIIQDTVVGPSLGKESIEAGMTSFALAFVLVLIYMAYFYNRAGMYANIALLANLFFLFGVLASINAVLTLPGIAGIVLTMGMAVDANVIIFERIKEELRAGKGLSQSISDGFSNAISAVVDGNLTTLITGIALLYGKGPVRGFATTLIIGILTSMFSAIFLPRLMFAARLAKEKTIRFSNKLTENFMSNVRFDFMGKRKLAYIISGSLILISLISLATRGMQYGVDFLGGRSYVVKFDRDVTANEVREAMGKVFTESYEVKQFGGANQMRIVTQYKYNDLGENVSAEIEGLFYKALLPLYKDQNMSLEEFVTTDTNPLGIISSDKVGATVAHDMKTRSVIAIIISLIAIGIYISIRFGRWQWALGGVSALTHDALLTIGLFSLLHGLLPFNMEVDQTFIAAILTIIGYSINNTVVIFDRIREYRTLYPKRDLRENINQAVASTLARTVNTSATTLVVLLAIFLFGGEVIRGFVFAIMYGIIVGTFSSIFIAASIAYDVMAKGKTAVETK